MKFAKLSVLGVLGLVAIFVEATEKDLAANLLARYQNNGRPVHDSTSKLDVSIQAYLLQIIDQPDDSLIASLLLIMKWRDEYLTWDPSEYGGIKKVILEADAVWKPDIVMYNDVYNSWAEIRKSMESVKLWVSSDGSVAWAPVTSFRVLCSAVTAHPRPQKNCTFSMGSWTHIQEELDIYLFNGLAAFNMTMYTPTRGINIDQQIATKTSAYYDTPVDGSAYPILNYSIVVEIDPK